MLDIQPRKIAITVEALDQLIDGIRYPGDIINQLPQPIYVSKTALLRKYGERGFMLYPYCFAQDIVYSYWRNFAFIENEVSTPKLSASELELIGGLDRLDPDNFLVVVRNLEEFDTLNAYYGDDDIIPVSQLISRYNLEAK